MAYIYKKPVGDKVYYYLRASARKGKRIVTKDIAYLGSNIAEVRESLERIPQQRVRKAYKTVHRFLESNTWLEAAKRRKLKASPFIEMSLLEEIGACKLHWQTVFQKHDKKTQQEYFKRFVIDFAFNTTSIEGNTITLKEAALLLTEHLTPKNKTLREIYDVQNTEQALNNVIEALPELSHDMIISIHADLMKNVDQRTGYRTGDVHVLRARFASTPAPYVKTDMGLLLTWYRKNEKIMHPLVLASIFHHKMEKIHPFFDGNGRAGRMLLNAILLKQGYPPIIVRKRNRVAYLEALSKADKADFSHTTPAHYKPLIEFIATELIETYWDIFL